MIPIHPQVGAFARQQNAVTALPFMSHPPRRTRQGHPWVLGGSGMGHPPDSALRNQGIPDAALHPSVAVGRAAG